MVLGSSDLVAGAFTHWTLLSFCNNLFFILFRAPCLLIWVCLSMTPCFPQELLHSGRSYGYYHCVFVLWIGCFCWWQLGPDLVLSFHLVVLLLGVPEAASAELSWCCMFLKVPALPFINVGNQSDCKVCLGQIQGLLKLSSVFDYPGHWSPFLSVDNWEWTRQKNFKQNWLTK